MTISIENARRATKLMIELEKFEKCKALLESRNTEIGADVKTLITIHTVLPIHIDFLGEDLQPFINVISNKILMILEEIHDLGFFVEEESEQKTI